MLDAVYTDISDAFDYFIEHYNQNRPIVIVSHSQGTHHAIRLLREIDSNPIVANRVVVAYTVGSTMVSLSQPFIDSLNNFSTCQDRRDVSCIAHWDTYGRNGTEKVFKSPEQSICVNPLSWKADGELADARMHSGAVSISGAFTTKLYGDDKSRNVVFENMNPPATAYTWAQCVDGFLYVADQQGTEYEKLGAVPDKSYHGIDFPLFHVNIRENVKDRIEAFFENGRL